MEKDRRPTVWEGLKEPLGTHLHDAVIWACQGQLWVGEHEVAHPQHQAPTYSPRGVVHGVRLLGQVFRLQASLSHINPALMDIFLSRPAVVNCSEGVYLMVMLVLTIYL